MSANLPVVPPVANFLVSVDNLVELFADEDFICSETLFSKRSCVLVGVPMSDTNPPAQNMHTLSNFDLFHRFWSKAVDSPRYSKQEWTVMEERLLKMGFLRDE